MRARNVLVVLLLGASVGVAWFAGRAREPRVPPRCPIRVEVVSDSFDELGCKEQLPELLARAGWPSGCAWDARAEAGLRDGDRLMVSGGCAVERGRMSGAALRLLGLPIDVNRASVEDLEALPGLGPVMAARIAASRPFRTLDELKNVSGIGPLRFAALRQAAEIADAREPDFGRR